MLVTGCANAPPTKKNSRVQVPMDAILFNFAKLPLIRGVVPICLETLKKLLGAFEGARILFEKKYNGEKRCQKSSQNFPRRI